MSDGVVGGQRVETLEKIWKQIIEWIKNTTKSEILNYGENCFTGDSIVYVKHGYRPIDEIKKGDDVYSRNEKTGESGFRKAEKVFRTEAHTIYHIWLNEREEIKTTAYHPFYIKDKGWVTAINLREGDLLETLGEMAYITKIKKERHEDPVTVYNLQVQEWVSFFISNMRVYVHNCGDVGINTDEDYENQEDKIQEMNQKPSLTNQEKGDLGEMKVDQDMKRQGYERINGNMYTGQSDAGHHGIDGVYYNADKRPMYVIVEAKYNKAKLSSRETRYGKQMSFQWIIYNLSNEFTKERLDDILVKMLETTKGEKLIGMYVAHVDKDNTAGDSYDELICDDNNSNNIENKPGEDGANKNENEEEQWKKCKKIVKGEKNLKNIK